MQPRPRGMRFFTDGRGERQWSVGLMAYPLYEGALDGCGGVFEESEAFAVSPEEKRSDDGAI